MDVIVEAVGRNLRRLRLHREFSLAQLAERSAVAKATLVNLEAGRGNPTIDTLWALALALGVAFSDLLEEPDTLPLRIVRADEGAHVGGNGDGGNPADAPTGDLRLLDRISGAALLEVYDLTISSGGRREGRAHGPGIVERAVVTEGSMLLGSADEPVELRVGDSIRYPAHRSHVYAALGGPARAVLLVEYTRRAP